MKFKIPLQQHARKLETCALPGESISTAQLSSVAGLESGASEMKPPLKILKGFSHPKHSHDFLNNTDAIIVIAHPGGNAVQPKQKTARKDHTINNIIQAPNISFSKYNKVCFRSAKETFLSIYRPST